MLEVAANLRPRARGASRERVMPRKDEELGKRDDDFRPRRHSTAGTLARPWRWRKRRILVVFAVASLLYVFIRNLPTSLGSIDARLGAPLRSGHAIQDLTSSVSELDRAPPQPVGSSDGESKHYYDGLIKFYKLVVSLHRIGRTSGTRPINRNVLFPVSSLRSAANLMPMACEMAKWDRNYVHMAFMGRDPLPLDDILEINGVDQEDCTVFFHDARADFSEYSTDRRAEIAVGGAMKHINDFVHPQVLIMDDSSVEDDVFTRAIRAKARESDRTLIEIPAGRYEEFFWLTRLDSGSLSSWFMPTIDILIQAIPDSSGGLIRLVRSLQNGYYTGLKVPHLTIELPNELEHFAQKYLQELTWPPVYDASPLKSSTLRLRQRISAAHVSSEQASLRFVEAFYPTNARHDHVLVLSPRVEVSPLFLQYLHYTILEYRYSSYGSPDSESLLGISLDVPSMFVNGTGAFRPPVVGQMNSHKYRDEKLYKQTDAPPFLYQATSASASLVFGEKWATLHSFLTNRLAASHTGIATKAKKLVSETEPAWSEYLLELMRARGWSMLHPSIPFVSVHNELAYIPEEYTPSHPPGQQGAEVMKQSDNPEEEPFLTGPGPPALVQHEEHEIHATQPLHQMLPLDGDLPEMIHLPILTYRGMLTTAVGYAEVAKEDASSFRQSIGGCKPEDAGRKRVMLDLKTDDLFCPPGVEIEYDLEAEKSQEQLAAEVIAATAFDDEYDDQIDMEQQVRAVHNQAASVDEDADPDESEAAS